MSDEKSNVEDLICAADELVEQVKIVLDKMAQPDGTLVGGPLVCLSLLEDIYRGERRKYAEVMR